MRQRNITRMVIGIMVPMIVVFVFFQYDIAKFLKINIYLFQALALYIPLLMTIPLSKFLTRNWSSEQRQNSKNGTIISPRMQMVAGGLLVIGFVFLAGRGILAEALSVEPSELGGLGYGAVLVAFIFIRYKYPQLLRFPPDEDD